MNLLTMLEEPVAGTERILPWVVSTHIKDGGLYMNKKGLVSFTAEAGKGQVDLKSILALLSKLDHAVNLSVEDHGGSFPIPIFDPDFLSRFPDLTALEMERLKKMAREGNQLMEAQTLSPLDRADWPGLCESRVARGIQNMKRIVEELGAAST
jgi:hypothetical protein